MKVRLLFGGRFDLLALAGLLVGLGFSSPAPAQEAPDVVWEVAGTNSVSAVAFSPDGQQVGPPVAALRTPPPSSGTPRTGRRWRPSLHRRDPVQFRPA
jgi:hypothetical protein